MSKIEKVPTAPFHPGYGCAIFIIAVLTFGGMVTWMIYSGYEQDRQISAFTVTDAPPLETAIPAPEEKAALKNRLAEFSRSVSASQPAKLILTLADLNNLVILSSETGIGQYKGIIRFTGLDAREQTLLADIRWQMNNLPFTERKDRFLVGQATFKPELDTHSLELRIKNVVVPGKTVSEGFMHQLEQWPWLNLAKTRPEITTALAAISSFQITPEGTLVLDSQPAAKPPAAVK